MVRTWGWGPWWQVISPAVTLFTIPSNLALPPFSDSLGKTCNLDSQKPVAQQDNGAEKERGSTCGLVGVFWSITNTERVMTKAECLFAWWQVKGYIKEKDKKRQRSSFCFWHPQGRSLCWGCQWEFPTGSINTGILLRKQNAFQRGAVSNCVNTDIGTTNPKDINTIRQACALRPRECLHWWVTRSVWNPVHMLEETTRPGKPKSINESSNTNSSHLSPAPDTLWKSAQAYSRTRRIT